MLPSYALYLFRIFKEQPMFRPDPKIRSKCARLLLDSADLLRDTELVELNGIEPMTSCLQSRRSPN